jgi:DNA gyrase inhibitor GyrI
MMIVLKDLLVKETQTVDTEEGMAELPGGLYAEFIVNDTDNAVVPVNEGTFNALTELMVTASGQTVETTGA